MDKKQYPNPNLDPKKIIQDTQHCYLGKTRLTNGNGIVQHALSKDKSMKGDIHVQITEQ